MKKDCLATDYLAVRSNATALRQTAQQSNSPQPLQHGLVCPQCGCRHFEVLYTRRAYGGKLIRRRACRHCGRRITTSETRLG